MIPTSHRRRPSRLAFSALAAVVLAAAPTTATAQEADIALVHRLLLDRQLILRPAGGELRAAELGDRLGHADWLRTSDNTRAAIRFTDDGSLVRVNPNTTLEIRAEGDRSALTKTVELEFGELWARVTRRPGTEFQVRTPAGVAAVKGTEFLVRVAGDGSTTLITLSGVLDFFTDVGTVEVPAGMAATAASAAAMPQVEPTTETALDGVEELVAGDEAPEEEELVEVVFRFQDDLGRVRTLIMEVPRSAAARYLGGLR
jgi:hypothetical protein